MVVLIVIYHSMTVVRYQEMLAILKVYQAELRDHFNHYVPLYHLEVNRWSNLLFVFLLIPIKALI